MIGPTTFSTVIWMNGTPKHGRRGDCNMWVMLPPKVIRAVPGTLMSETQPASKEQTMTEPTDAELDELRQKQTGG